MIPLDIKIVYLEKGGKAVALIIVDRSTLMLLTLVFF